MWYALRRVAFLALLLLLGGCATRYEPYLQPALERGDVVLVVDACVLQDEVSSNKDYLPIEESAQLARAVAAQVTDHLHTVGIRPKSVEYPFLCGVQEFNEPVGEPVAARVGADIRNDFRPFHVAPHLSTDLEYAAALRVLGTHSFVAAFVADMRKRLPNTPLPPLPVIESQAVEDAVKLVAAKAGAASIVYINMKGRSFTDKKARIVALKSFLRTAIMAVGSVAISGGAWVVLAFGGGDVQRSIETVGLYDANTGTLATGSIMRKDGNPFAREHVESSEFTSKLLHALLYREAPAK